MAEKFLFKDIFNEQMLGQIAQRIKTTYPKFNIKDFTSFILPEFPKQEFKERSLQITLALEKFLPNDYPTALKILNDSLPDELLQKDILGDRNYDRFYLMSYGDFVVRNGLKHFDLSMIAIYKQTKRFTAEYAVRPFIKKYPQKSLDILSKWTEDDNLHVRRLVSEGTRPRLPWGMKLKQFITDPIPVLNLLEKLKYDPSTYVRRSVANSLNDIAKDNPRFVLERLEKWQNGTKDIKWLTSHALRTLLKDGNQKALMLCGFDDGENIILDELKLKKERIEFGGCLEFEITIRSSKEKIANLMLDYAIYYQKANGSQSRKVLKLKKMQIEPNQNIVLTGKREFKPVTTRKFYAGTHKIEIIANGKVLGEKEFKLILNY